MMFQKEIKDKSGRMNIIDVAALLFWKLCEKLDALGTSFTQFMSYYADETDPDAKDVLELSGNKIKQSGRTPDPKNLIGDFVHKQIFCCSRRVRSAD